MTEREGNQIRVRVSYQDLREFADLCARLDEYAGPREATGARCTERESGGVQCELPAGHLGGHACPEALARYRRVR
jgi:hypothetical protein